MKDDIFYDNKASEIKKLHDKFGSSPNGFSYPFYINPNQAIHPNDFKDPSKIEFKRISYFDGLWHTGKMLATYCLEFKYHYHNGDKAEARSIAYKIQKTVGSLFHMSRMLSDFPYKKGVPLARFFNREEGPSYFKLSSTGSRFYPEITFDQVMSLVYGLHHVYEIKKELCEFDCYATVEDANLLAKNIGNHFLKYNGFVGQFNNLRAYPWSANWNFSGAYNWIRGLFGKKDVWRYRQDLNWFKRKFIYLFDRYFTLWVDFILFGFLLRPFFKIADKNVIYRLGILSVCFNITNDIKFLREFKDTVGKYDRELNRLAKRKLPGQSWFQKTSIKFLFNVRNHKFKFWKWFSKLPADHDIIPNHLVSTIGPNLRFFSFPPILEIVKDIDDDDTEKLLKELYSREYFEVKNRKHPWYDCNFLYFSRGWKKAFLYDKISEEMWSVIDKNMLDYRGPKMSFSTTIDFINNVFNHESDDFVYSVNLDGTTTAKSRNPLSPLFYRYHLGWCQSDVYVSGDSPQGWYDDCADWLYCYWIRKLMKG